MKWFVCLILLICLVVALEEYTRDSVYVCSDGESNPPDVVKQCKHLTKYQWWGHYYQGVRK